MVTGLIFLAVFGGALGDRLDLVEDVAYVRFILPGLLVLTVAGQAFANASTSLFQAKSEGYIEDVLTSPMGGVFYSADRLEAPWRALTRFDPIYYLVDATRGGWTAINDASIAVALAVAAAAAVALYAVAVALVARGWRLKP